MHCSNNLASNFSKYSLNAGVILGSQIERTAVGGKKLYRMGVVLKKQREMCSIKRFNPWEKVLMGHPSLVDFSTSAPVGQASKQARQEMQSAAAFGSTSK